MHKDKRKMNEAALKYADNLSNLKIKSMLTYTIKMAFKVCGCHYFIIIPMAKKLIFIISIESYVEVTLVSSIKSDTNSFLMNSFCCWNFRFFLRHLAFRLWDWIQCVCFRQARKWNFQFSSVEIHMTPNMIDILWKLLFKLKFFQRQHQTQPTHKHALTSIQRTKYYRKKKRRETVNQTIKSIASQIKISQQLFMS